MNGDNKSNIFPWPLRSSKPDIEGVLRVSKSLKHQVLLDEEEMRSLLDALDPVLIYAVSEAVDSKSGFIEQAHFLQKYAQYVECLKNGVFPEERPLRRFFSSIFTTTPDLLYAMEVGHEKFLIKALKPIIQLQGHHFFVSSIDGVFHPMVLGEESITWGIQFSYPQIYQSPKQHDYAKVVDSSDFPNTALFNRLVKWLRQHTLPTPFIFDGKQTNVPIRLGKQCFPWINKHPGLIAKRIKVKI